LVGYYFWQASQLVLAVGALWANRAVLRKRKTIGLDGDAADPIATADGGREAGFTWFTVVQRGRD
jgi:hypothetical protein